MTTQTRTAPAGMTFALDGRRHHKLMDAASVRALPPIMSQESKPESEKYAPVKLFSPYNGQRWYLLEFDLETAQAFCFTTTENNDPEYCYVSVRDLGQAAGMRGALPLIERDLHWTPAIVADIRSGKVY